MLSDIDFKVTPNILKKDNVAKSFQLKCIETNKIPKNFLHSSLFYLNHYVLHLLATTTSLASKKRDHESSIYTENVEIIR